ncbi:heme-binding domain-containing protein [Nemorincola caseinilytica]|uniref:Heme-binding domain-containing protein n=1 Tax=Nemorincola caseinilytica TaxID=2054315 RepID=A0ABP8N0X4_9BACT
MKKAFKVLGIGLLVVLAVLQVWRPEKNVSAQTPPSDIVTAYAVPANVADVLHRACYDCHSNNTHYPWYSNVQPVGIWLADHIEEGKDELNFSEFGNYKTRRKLKKLKEIVEEVEEGAMPLSSYTWIHKEAVLSPADKQLVIEWAKGLAQKISLEPGAQE